MQGGFFGFKKKSDDDTTKVSTSDNTSSVRTKLASGVSKAIHSTGITSDIYTKIPASTQRKIKYEFKPEEESLIEAYDELASKSKCKVYITCENALKLKTELKNRINYINTSFDTNKIIETQKDIASKFSDNNFVNLFFNRNFEKFVNDTINEIKKEKQKESEKTLKLTDKIPVKLLIKDMIDDGKKDGCISEINIISEALTIEYDKNGLRKEKIKISDLCIMVDADKDVVDETCNLTIQEGGKYNRKNSKYIKGGSITMSSISTSDLC